MPRNHTTAPLLSRGIVTTTKSPREGMLKLAHALCRQLDMDYIPYRNSVKQALEEGEADYAVVVERDDLKVAWKEGVFRHHPGLAIYRVGVNQPSHFLGAVRPRWGERTLDLTLGFGRDALWLADRTDQRVDGYEVNPTIATVTAYGLQRLLRIKRFVKVAPRIRVYRGDSFNALTRLGRNRYEIVLMDPLFPRPVRGSIDMEFLHNLVQPRRFDVETLRLAASVASRRIVLRWPRSQPAPDLGFDQIVPGPKGRYDYLVLDLSRKDTQRRLRRR